MYETLCSSEYDWHVIHGSVAHTEWFIQQHTSLLLIYGLSTSKQGVSLSDIMNYFSDTSNNFMINWQPTASDNGGKTFMLYIYSEFRPDRKFIQQTNVTVNMYQFIIIRNRYSIRTFDIWKHCKIILTLNPYNNLQKVPCN